MMTNKQKIKGRQWESDLVKLLLQNVGGEWKRIPTSGAIGTYLGEPKLTGDVVGKVDFISLPFRIEAKVGYGGEKSITVQREWFEKIKREAQLTNSYPAVVCKYSGARGDVKYIVQFDFDTFVKLMNEISSMYDELEKFYDNKEKS